MLNVYLNLLYLSNLQTATNSMVGIRQQSAKFLQVGTQGYVHCTVHKALYSVLYIRLCTLYCTQGHVQLYCKQGYVHCTVHKAMYIVLYTMIHNFVSYLIFS